MKSQRLAPFTLLLLLLCRSGVIIHGFTSRHTSSPRPAYLPTSHISSSVVLGATPRNSQGKNQSAAQKKKTRKKKNETTKLATGVHSTNTKKVKSDTLKTIALKNDSTSKLDPLQHEVEAAAKQAAEAEVLIEELQASLLKTQSQLAAKERKLVRNQKAWDKEKNTLNSRVEELDGLMLVSSLDGNQTYEGALQLNVTLEKEVDDLRLELNQTEKALLLEQQKAEALRTRLEDAADQYEFEQMRFEREKEQLQTELKELKSRLSSFDKEMTVNDVHFNRERQELDDEIDAYTRKLIDMERQLAKQESEFQKREQALAQTVEKQSNMLDEMQFKLSTSQDQYKLEKTELENRLLRQEAEFVSKESELNAAIAAQAETIAAIQSEYATNITGLESRRQDLDDWETRLTEEISRVNDLSNQLEIERKLYRREKRSLQTSLGQAERLLTAEQQHLSLKSDEANDLSRAKRELKRTVSAQTVQIQKLEQQLDKEQKQYEVDKLRLETNAQEASLQLRELATLSESREKTMNETAEDMEMRIVFKIAKANKLTEELEMEREKSRQLTQSLESSLVEQKSKVAEMEELLAKEKNLAATEKQRLEAEIARGEEALRQTTTDMQERYESVQSEMTELWQEEKLKGQAEAVRLDNLYKDRITSLTNDVSRLKVEADDADQMRKQVSKLAEENGVLLNVNAYTEAMVKQKSDLLDTYLDKIDDRDEAIAALEEDLSTLRSGISNLDAQNESERSSFRSLLKMTVDLAKKRVRKKRRQ